MMSPNNPFFIQENIVHENWTQNILPLEVNCFAYPVNG